jgi:hypothetical protein
MIVKGTVDQLFHVINGDTEAFYNLRPRLAAGFGCKIPDPMFPNSETPNSKGSKNYESPTIKFGDSPPIRSVALSLGLSSDPLVEDPPTLLLQTDTPRWAKGKDVSQA